MNQRASHAAIAIVGVSLLLGGSAPLRAEDQKQQTVCPICGRASDQTASYSAKAGSTLVRGAANAALGWTELISEPVHEVKSGGNVFVGIGKGVGLTVTRTLSGLGEVLTFWTPKVNNRYVAFAHDCPICMGKNPPSAH